MCISLSNKAYASQAQYLTLHTRCMGQLVNTMYKEVYGKVTDCKKNGVNMTI